MRAAGDAGLPEAYVALGLMTNEGRAGPGDKAIDWFELAANAGDAQGMFLFAVALTKGDGRPKDPNLAAVWLDRALEAADPADTEFRRNAEALREEIAEAQRAAR